MPLSKEKQTCSTDDIYALPDGQRAELINGQMFMMAPPDRKHQKLVYHLGRVIGDYIISNEKS